jgi:hypothetical protein
MKVTNWRRKLMASLVAAGLMSPAAARAADLNTNLIVDPSFENVDPANAGPFMSNRLLDWPDTALDGNATDDNWAFRFAQNYAGVNTPAGAGSRYFSGGFGTTVGQATLAQSVGVSTGASGTLIASGEAAFQLSGFFSGYLTQADASSFRLRFLNAGGTEISRTSVGGAAFIQTLPLQPGTYGNHRNWGQDSRSGLIPVGTASVAAEIVSDIAAGNHDGYVDLLDFRIVSAANFLLFLEVNTNTGQATLKNQTGAAVNIDYYEVTSATGALNSTAWNSLQEQNLAGFPAGSGSGNGWEQFGGSNSGVIGESYLTGNSAVANNAAINLGAAFNVGGAQNLVFSYGALPSSTANPTGDYNNNGVVDGPDYVLWRNGGPLLNDPTPGVQAGDYGVWRAAFGQTGGPSGPSTLINGFVRYVTSGVGAGGAVPEPTSVFLVGIGLAALAVPRCRKTED